MPPRKRRSKERYGPPPAGDGFELVIGPAGRCPHAVPDVGAGRLCRDGFAADGTPCYSRYDSDEHREAVWWQSRDSLVVDRCERGPFAGTRPWGWWRYEAAAACRCAPPCDRPRLRDRDGQRAWLERHGVLGPQEQSIVARQPRPVDD